MKCLHRARAARSILPAVLLVLASFAGVGAQTIQSPYRFLDRNQAVGVLGGYISASKGTLDLGPQPGPVFGGRWGIRVSGPFVIEAEAAYFPSTRAVRDTTPADTTLRTIGEADLNLALVRGGLRFDLTGPRTYRGLQPFLLFGGGIAVDLASEAEIEEELPADVRYDFGTSFAGELGAGIEWHLSSGTTLRVDGRNTLWRISTPRAFLQGQRGFNLPDGEWAQNFYVTAGLSLRF